MIADLNRLAGDAHHIAELGAPGVLGMSGVADRLVGPVVAGLVAVSDGDELGHGNGTPG